MVYAQSRISPGEWETQNSLGFCDTNGLPNLGQMTRPNDSQQKKWNCWIVDFAVLAGHRVKIKESEKRDKYPDLAREQKTMEHEGDSDTNCGWCTSNKPKRTGRLGNKRTSREHPDYRIIKTGQNTEKSPGDLRRLSLKL